MILAWGSVERVPVVWGTLSNSTGDMTNPQVNPEIVVLTPILAGYWTIKEW